MSELPGTAAVGVERVEWSAASGESITVLVTGRWRRRRLVSGGQATLVLEGAGRRHRFPAMPEPPSLDGAAPGKWRLSFVVPAALEADLGARMWLQLGTIAVPLPAAVRAPDTAPDPSPDPSPGLMLVPEPGAGQTPAVDPLLERIGELERDLERARAGRDQLAASLAERDRTRRLAEQRAFSEQALRRDLARRLADSEHRVDRAREALGDLAAAEERIRALEQELAQARRRVDEAEQVAAAAAAARERDRHPRPASVDAVADVTGDSDHAQATRLAAEQRLRVLHGAASVTARVTAEPPLRPLAPPAPPPGDRAVVPAPAAPPAPADNGPLVTALRAELHARVTADAPLRARLVQAESRLAARVVLDRRTSGVLGELRQELAGLRAGFEHERSLRIAAELRIAELERELGGQRVASRGAYDAIGELRAALERLSRPAEDPDLDPDPDPDPDRPAAASGAAPPPADADVTGAPAEPQAGAESLVEPERLSDALSRLRDKIAPQDPDATDPEPVVEAEPEAEPVDAPVMAAEPAADPVEASIPDPEPEASEELPEPEVDPEGAVPAPSVASQLGRPRLEGAFRRLAATEPAAAGTLLLELLALQHAVHPRPVAYDIVLGAGEGCVAVSSADGATTVTVAGAPRPLDEVDFQLIGDRAQVAKLLIAGRLRQRWGIGVARVRGQRAALAAPLALLSLPLDLPAPAGASVDRPDQAGSALVRDVLEAAQSGQKRAG
jgi:hypothetical protein